jgi:DNA-binding CsgD family transcriptional regulator
MASSVVVHPSGLLDALCEFFEVLWARALPLSAYLAGRPNGAGDAPSSDEARLLALLTTGLTDQVMARQLGVSYRTFQRRLSGLMERLGAGTRFQLGMRAASLGWVSQPADPAVRLGAGPEAEGVSASEISP